MLPGGLVEEDVAFMTVPELALLLSSGAMTSGQLRQLFADRLRR
jgi:hypothetical protein